MNQDHDDLEDADGRIDPGMWKGDQVPGDCSMVQQKVVFISSDAEVSGEWFLRDLPPEVLDHIGASEVDDILELLCFAQANVLRKFGVKIPSLPAVFKMGLQAIFDNDPNDGWKSSGHSAIDKIPNEAWRRNRHES